MLAIVAFVIPLAQVATALASIPRFQSLQTIHPIQTPEETLKALAESCKELGIDDWDVYGDYDKDAASSFLRNFEAELAEELGMEDCVFMPSGTMAQQIALLIHQKTLQQTRSSAATATFACHPTCHLLLHEEDAYDKLIHMNALVINSTNYHETTMEAMIPPVSIPPLLFQDVVRIIDGSSKTLKVSTLILELPHREIGGRLTPWEDIVKMREFCTQNNIRFHCDGARLFEAATGYGRTLQEVATPFDSVYISFYKGLGGMAGSALLGSKDFCEQARVWLSRFGGNLYTLLPYAVSSMAGYRKHWKLRTASDDQLVLSFAEKKAKMVKIIAELQKDTVVSQIVRFDPSIPETNIVHGYLSASIAECETALDRAAAKCGVRVLHRIKELGENDIARSAGYRIKFEWTMGASGLVPDATILDAWNAFANELLSLATDTNKQSV